MTADLPTLAERSLRLAWLGYVPADDQHVVADMQERIEELEAEVALWKDRYEAANQALEATIRDWNASLSEGSSP